MSLLHVITLFLFCYNYSAAAQQQQYQFQVPGSGLGVGNCSSFNVSSLSFKANCSAPGVSAILTTSPMAFAALRVANMSAPSTAFLPAPLYDMSCLGANLTSCDKAILPGRSLNPQPICILLKKEDGSGESVDCTVIVDYVQANTTMTNASSSPLLSKSILFAMVVVVVVVTVFLNVS